MALEKTCLQRLFKEQAHRTPAELAVVGLEGEKTYLTWIGNQMHWALTFASMESCPTTA